MSLYIYCFIEPVERTFDAIPVGNPDAPVYSVCEGDIGAVVSESHLKEYDPIRRHVLAHQRVLEAVKNAGRTPVPMRFGTVIETRDDLATFIRNHYDRIATLIRELRGCVEMGVKVLWDTQAVLNELAKSDPDIRAEKQALAGLFSSQEQIIDLGKLLEERLQVRREALARDMMGFLSQVTSASKRNDFHDEVTILNAAFLIPQAEESAFDRRIEELDALYDGRWTIKYVGPLIPYTFAELRVGEP